MDILEKYQIAFSQLGGIIDKRRENGIFTALGYTSNLDVISNFDVEVLNKLLEKNLPDEDIETMQKCCIINSIKDFLRTVVYYCRNGIGGENDVADISILDNTFSAYNGIGGTAVQGAKALAEIGCQSIVHLTDDSKEVCDLLSSPYIYMVAEGGGLCHSDKVISSSDQEIHYIMQFKKGDEVISGSRRFKIPNSNRLIITKVTTNACVPFYKPYFEYIESNADKISSNLLSSFNCIQDKAVLLSRLSYVSTHIKKYKAGNPDGIVYFEDAHYHDQDIKKITFSLLCPDIDILSLNEEELQSVLESYGIVNDIEDINSVINGLAQLIDRFGIKYGIIVHTKDYSMYYGEKLKADIENGLIYGNLLATAKAMYGKYGDMDAVRKAMQLPLSPVGLKYRKQLAAQKNEKAVVVPSRYIDKPRYTVGLGDSFAAGVQICF